MELLVIDPRDQQRLIAEHQAGGGDRFDEVWEGTYIRAPLLNDEHQDIQAKLVAILQLVVGWRELGLVRAGVNVSDRDDGWELNYRCPDVAVFMRGIHAQNRESHWVGGPDFAVEILSPGDRTTQKLPFYASIGVQELLIIDRDPWSLELYQLGGDELGSIGTVMLQSQEALVSSIVPLTFRLRSGARPMIEVSHRDTAQQWLV